MVTTLIWSIVCVECVTLCGGQRKMFIYTSHIWAISNDMNLMEFRHTKGILVLKQTKFA